MPVLEYVVLICWQQPTVHKVLHIRWGSTPIRIQRLRKKFPGRYQEMPRRSGHKLQYLKPCSWCTLRTKSVCTSRRYLFDELRGDVEGQHVQRVAGGRVGDECHQVCQRQEHSRQLVTVLVRRVGTETLQGPLPGVKAVSQTARHVRDWLHRIIHTRVVKLWSKRVIYPLGQTDK